MRRLILSLGLAVILGLGGCGGDGGSGDPQLPAPPPTDADAAELSAFLDDYNAWLEAQDDPAAAAAELESDPRYQAWLEATG